MPVENQSNNIKYGVFSIAFAVELIHGVFPSNVAFEVNSIREHLLCLLLAYSVEVIIRNGAYKMILFIVYAFKSSLSAIQMKTKGNYWLPASAVVNGSIDDVFHLNPISPGGGGVGTLYQEPGFFCIIFEELMVLSPNFVTFPVFILVNW